MCVSVPWICVAVPQPASRVVTIARREKGKPLKGSGLAPHFILHFQNCLALLLPFPSCVNFRKVLPISTKNKSKLVIFFF